MRKGLGSLGILVLLAAPAGHGTTLDPAAFVGSDRCGTCHPDKHAGWSKTFHATVVQDARKNPGAVLGDFSVPNLGFTLDDVDYTIGGHWDQRYIKKIGDEYYVLPKLWSVQSRKWRPYNVWSWRKMPYSKYCEGCHVTGLDPERGTVAERRIGCEACHGPGRAHAESGGKGPVVNPAKLPDDRREMICAACHVRGTDPTGTYRFPVGYVPGDDLAQHYVPARKEEGETDAQAILRAFARWKKKREEGAQVKCEVCGIPGISEEADETKVGSMMAFCFGCHGFKDQYDKHTRHPASTGLACFDCHVQQTAEMMNPGDRDIHSYGYFLVHAEKCYDPAIEKACLKCHADRGVEWARRTVETWRRPVDLDH